MFKKGSVLVRIPPPEPVIPIDGPYKEKKRLQKVINQGPTGTSGIIDVLHVDIIKDTFWNERPWLLKQV